LNVLLNCLPQLEEREALYIGFSLAAPARGMDTPGEHLKKLVEFLKPLREINTPPATYSREVDILSMMSPVEQKQPQHVVHLDPHESHFGFEDTAGELS
jgi:hypothetical protein